MKIPLFDLDWTLIKGGNKTHLNAYKVALQKVFNIEASYKQIDIQGKIEPQILQELALFNKVPIDMAKEKLPDALNEMANYFSIHKNDDKSTIMPGAYNLLKQLKDKNALIGVLTGNIESIGWVKLDQVNLKKFIDFGSFGNMAIKRVDLIPIALQIVQNKFNPQASLSDLVIVGDAVRDVECAKDGGIKVVGVASGLYSEKDLKIAGADLVVSSLLKQKEIFDFLEI